MSATSCYRTPVDSVLFAGAVGILFSILTNLGVRNQEAFQLLDNTAGLFISGDVGSGKSVLGRQIHRALAMSGDVTVIALDPDNDFVEDCLRDVADMPASVRERAYAFFPADPKWPIGPINPLHVYCDETTSEYEYEARLECRALYASHLPDPFSGRAG